VKKENDQLLNVLNTTHQINTDIGQRLLISQQTKLEIAKMFDLYRGVAERGQILYFVISLMNRVEPMYYCSLEYYMAIFRHNIQLANKNAEFSVKIAQMIRNTLISIYRTVAGGFFHKDRLTFQFLLAFKMDQYTNRYQPEAWGHFISNQALLSP